MGRFRSTTVAAVLGALAVGGCGATTATTESLQLTVPPRADGPAQIAPTAGRLGDATVVRPAVPLRELSRGGEMDVRLRGNAPRRDGVGAGAACANPGLAASTEALPAMAEATLCLLNGERADNGLAPLAPNAKLAAAATAYAQDMVDGSFFSHTGNDGSDVLGRIEASGYLPADAGWVLGENLAWGTGGLATPGAIMEAWMNSHGHRDNILNPDFREIGIGIVTGNPAAPDGLGATYATEFGAIESFGDEDESEPVAVAKPRKSSQRAKKSRKHARRHAKARNSRRIHQPRRAGKRHGKAAGKRRGRVGHIKARIAI